MKNELLEIAAAALKVDSKDIKDNFKELPEINACYFGFPVEVEFLLSLMKMAKN